MRTLPDRIRHTILFEVIALVVVAFLGSWIIGRSVTLVGALSLIFSFLAMAWNLAFNWMFDHWDRIYRNSAPRGFRIRALHAFLFELGMLIAGLFIVSWWLETSYREAFLINIGFSLFFLVYAYVYNWAYDQIFPVPG
ncbi:MAG: PACE efflux transporter [Methyloligellaceae bacterium]